MSTWAEVRIPVPWGYIAAKSKGNPKDQPVLCVHGIQDNAGTFDHLIPLLPASFFYVCIDLPGHGLSSHLPMGIAIDFFDYVLVLKRIMNHFKWKKVIYMSHSLGGQLGAYFSAIFPQNVSKLIMLDAVAPMCVPPEEFWGKQKQVYSGLWKIEQRMKIREAPQYSYNEAVNKLMMGRFSKLSKQSAETLAKRSLVTNKDGYSYSTDQRLKLTLWAQFDAKTQLNTLARIQCPHLIILASETSPVFKVSFIRSIITVYKRRQNFNIHTVKGSHDVHLDHPERVAQFITSFLKYGKSYL